ncbi:N-acetylmuramoyl-L-alanine amidase [Ureibacillus massiliensis]|uniref:N-acetylmuramoyl-L-alanine amidase n=1 Tax=Ureibacillus massiliensis TaxID=292806 RepID=UPI00068A7CA4|nr:N-acetylmuramoyl-L-alanine amidase [Ureibacillus massiliensis]
MVKIGYDAGHGINTPGKRTPDDEREWTFNDQVARAFAKELELYDDVTLKRFDDPTGEEDVPLDARTDGANSWGADYYISFHHNALSGNGWGTHTGVETYVYTDPGSESLKLAEAIHPAVVKAYGLSDRGIKRANLHIVRETLMPAILIEGGFMDSSIDIKKLRDRNVLENAGKLIAQALGKFLRLSRNGVVDDLDFYSPTMRYKYLMRVISPATKQLLVEKAVEELRYQPQWIENHNKGILKPGDYTAIAYELAVHYAKLDR